MKQFAVIGLGHFGSSIATTLFEMGFDVLAIDNNEEKVQEMSDKVTHAVQADSTNENALIALGVKNFDVAIVSIGQDMQANILTTLILKELGVKQVVAKARTEHHGKVLYRIGADRVVFPERDMGIRVAHNLVSANIIDYIELSPNFSIVEIVAPESIVGKTLRELDMRAKFGVNIIAIKTGENINLTPKADDRIKRNDIIIVVGKTDRLRKLETL
ncbi:MAG: potassium uptake system protein [Firmicutes bacterium HGW-Firmicutes-13]|nr:MAG: potassium uptake system protein [Firmicutes bacterium HGW-Firmicutes-13]